MKESFTYQVDWPKVLHFKGKGSWLQIWHRQKLKQKGHFIKNIAQKMATQQVVWTKDDAHQSCANYITKCCTVLFGGPKRQTRYVPVTLSHINFAVGKQKEVWQPIYIQGYGFYYPKNCYVPVSKKPAPYTSANHLKSMQLEVWLRGKFKIREISYLQLHT